MGKIYNINMCKNFLEEMSIFFKNHINSKNIVEYTVILPNNRSCRELKKYLIEANLFCLPKIISVSDIFLFNDHSVTMLIVEILNKRNKNIPINTIFELAVSITKLLKEFIVNNIEYTQLKDLVPTHLMEYWKHTITIIYECAKSPDIKKIITTATLGLHQFIKTISKDNQKIIAAGIGNTNYFTKQLLGAVFASENGLIFTISDENSQNQAYNKEIFGDIIYKQFNNTTNNSITTNNTTKVNQAIRREIAEFNDISEEAQAIAISVRQAIHEQEKVLIVVSNIDLATRIKSELMRWNIIPDDSYGVDFSKTYSGILIYQILDAISNQFSTSSVLKILKMHKTWGKYFSNLELCLKQKNAANGDFYEFICEQDTLNYDLMSIVDNFYNVLNNKGLLTNKILNQNFKYWTYIIRDIVETIDIESSTKFMEIIKKYLNYSEAFRKISFDEYSIFLKKHCLRSPVRHARGYTNGVIMLGVIEAQLIESDFIIIANANENSLTSSEQENFWMNTSMMKTLRIPTKENQDKFIQCIFERLVSKKHVLVTRSKKISGEPQVKYQFLSEIERKFDLKKTTTLTNFIENRDNSIKQCKICLPSPMPKQQYRPNRMSVTDIELLKNNAYAFYAKKILRIKELNEIDEVKNLRGNYIHAVLDYFVKKYNQYNIYQAAYSKLKQLNLDETLFGLWFFRINDILAFVEKNTNGHSVSEVWGEYQLQITNDYKCKIICKADRIDKNTDGTISIIDYKTTAEKITKKSVEEIQKIQLPLEAWIAKNNGFNEINKTDVSSLQYWFLRKNCEKTIITSDCNSTNQLIEKTINNIIDLIEHYNIACAPFRVNISDKYNDSYMHLARVKEWLDA